MSVARADEEGDPRRRIPGTDTVMADPRLASAVSSLGPAAAKGAVTRAQERARNGEIQPEAVADIAAASLPPYATTLRPVINATGVVLHTNLGRAPLAPAAVNALGAAAGHTDIEYDAATGQRGQRGHGTLEAIAAAVPTAEAVHVVNNGAAALVLAVTALAQDREILLSRGEMVEIGDGFRLPDVLESTGATLREVGTTNRTALDDYRSALGPRAGVILKVHPSNFVMTGFVSDVSVQDLASLGVPVVVDIGSGLLAADPLLPDEPDATTVLSDGADLVTASSDKLLGGPQAGLLLGRASVMETVRRHPLARALRVGKLTMAALEATVRGPEPPVWQSLRRSECELRARAEHLCDELRQARIPAETVKTSSVVGGGGAPGLEFDSWAVALDPDLAQLLRVQEPRVVGRIERDRLLLDLRCVPPEDDAAVYAAVLTAVHRRWD